MKKYGQAIYASRPWSVLPLETYIMPLFTISSENKSNNVRIRFLEKNGNLYIFFNPDLITDKNILTIPYVRIPETSNVQLCTGPDSWSEVPEFKKEGYSTKINLPANDYHDPMHCLQIHPIPDWLIVPSLEYQVDS